MLYLCTEVTSLSFWLLYFESYFKRPSHSQTRKELTNFFLELLFCFMLYIKSLVHLGPSKVHTMPTRVLPYLPQVTLLPIPLKTITFSSLNERPPRSRTKFPHVTVLFRDSRVCHETLCAPKPHLQLLGFTSTF